jgi:solute carrier family 25 (mitochondrial phosphate transporter), member 3
MATGAPSASTGSAQLDAIKQVAASKVPGQLTGIDLYSRFAFAGAVCCSVTHGALTPVDV